MDSSRFRKINRDAKQEFPLCIVFQTNVNKIKVGTRREMPLERLVILHQWDVQLVFPSPLGILLINQGNWLAGFH